MIREIKYAITLLGVKASDFEQCHRNHDITHSRVLLISIILCLFQPSYQELIVLTKSCKILILFTNFSSPFLILLILFLTEIQIFFFVNHQPPPVS